MIPMNDLIIAGLLVVTVIVLISILARLYRKAGPHEALVVYGFRGTRIVKGHGTVIFPMIEMCKQLSLELMSFDVAPQQDLYTRQGVAVTVEDYYGHLKDPVVFGSIGWLRVGHMNRLEKRLVAESHARGTDHARECRFRELREIVRVLASIDDPHLAFATLEHEAVTGSGGLGRPT